MVILPPVPGKRVVALAATLGRIVTAAFGPLTGADEAAAPPPMRALVETAAQRAEAAVIA